MALGYTSVILRMAVCLIFSSSGAQLSSAFQDRAPVQVSIQYCDAKPQKPPLEKLSFRVSMRNLTDEPEWVLLPLVLYPVATHAKENAGVSHIELLSDESRKIKVLRFAGTARVLAGMSNQGAGFQAVLLAGAVEEAFPIIIDYWGMPNHGPLPISGATARRLILRGEPIGDYFRTPLPSATATAEHLFVIESWQTTDQEEAPIVAERTAQFRIANALANKCTPKTP